MRPGTSSVADQFGYTADEMVGQSILRLIPRELHYEEDEILHKIRAGERVDHFEATRIRKDGSSITVSVTISPIRDEQGHVVGASKSVRDISDRKRMENLLIQAEKLAATGRMAATIAHEINNPLGSLMNLIFLARHNSPKDGTAHQYLLTAENEVERVSATWQSIHRMLSGLSAYPFSLSSQKLRSPDLDSLLAWSRCSLRLLSGRR